MATELLAVIRVSSGVDQFEGPGRTERAIRAQVGKVPMPEGRYGPPRLYIQELKQSTHDLHWGVVGWVGTLAEYADCDALQAWFRAVMAAISEYPHLGLTAGMLEVCQDGMAPVLLSHFGVIQRDDFDVLGDE